MRLTPKEVLTITTYLTGYSPKGRIYLHGSRIDDFKRGGDIDLFFIVSDDVFTKLSEISYKISAELSGKLNEQKNDLLIISESEARSHVFFNNSEKKIIN